jgi:hypothetical protein
LAIQRDVTIQYAREEIMPDSAHQRLSEPIIE